MISTGILNLADEPLQDGHFSNSLTRLGTGLGF